MLIAQKDYLEIPGYVWFSADNLQSNARYTFALGANGQSLFFRQNTPNSPWKIVPTPYSQVQFTKIRIDESLLVLITASGQIWRLKNILNHDPGNFNWLKTFGMPMGRGPAITVNPAQLQEITVSTANSTTTNYYTDRSGNKHTRYISHLYTTGPNDPYIHHADPWVINNWNYKFPLPKHNDNAIAPAKKGVPGFQVGLASAASIVGVISSLGVYTIEYDYDINGANPLVYYKPYNTQKYPGVQKLFFNKRTPITVPSLGWQKQPPIPGPYTGNLILKPLYTPDGKIVPGSDTRLLRVVGLHTVDGTTSAGYWEKKLTAPSWQFFSDPILDPTEVSKYLINKDAPELIPLPLAAYTQHKQNLTLSLEGFGPYANLWEGNEAKLNITSKNGKTYSLNLFTQIQLHTKKQNAATNDTYVSGFIALPNWFKNDDSPAAQQVRSLLQCQVNDTYVWVFIRANEKEILIRRNNSVFRKIDIFNWFNERLGKRLFWGKA